MDLPLLLPLADVACPDWYNRPTPSHPDFRHKISKAALWLNIPYKPASALLRLVKRDGGKKGSPEPTCTPGHACMESRCEADLDYGTLKKRVEEGELREAIEALDRLVQQGAYVDTALFYRVLKKCTAQKDLVVGRLVHALAVRSGYNVNKFLANHIIGMYSSHARLEEAMQVFTNVAAPDCYMWASIILAHARHGQAKKAIILYGQMRESSVKPDQHIFVAVLKACTTAENLSFGKEVHADITRTGVQLNKFVGNCLVDMYARCGGLEDACRVFDNLPTKDVVTWTAMIAGYAQHGQPTQAIKLYGKLRVSSVKPDNHLFVLVLHACAAAADLTSGREVHADILHSEAEPNVFVGNCLVDMYCKCGSLDDARKVFESLPNRDVVTWTAMLTGYVQHGCGQQALTLYSSMQAEGLNLADPTFVCLLKACASVGALHEGIKLHTQIQDRGLEANMFVGNSLVDMYAKCGRLEHARRVFDTLPSRDVVTWNALLNGYAEHSNGQMAIQCFEEMQKQGVKPDDTTFLCLLVACSHAGLVVDGWLYFKMMVEAHGIAPTNYHYNCMVDLLGRSGHLDEAESILRSNSFENDVVGWKSLLSASKSHCEVERARRCFDHLIRLEPEDATSYMLLENTYANAGRWMDVNKIESLRKSAGAEKKPGKACIEVKNKVHEFTVGEDRSDMSTKVRGMNLRLKEQGGYVPQTELVLKALSVQEKEDALCGHAEKLALAYGLLNTPAGITLLVNKNLRMCNDCHSSTKIMSRLESREIIVRDAHRVHHFLDGSCSCGDRQ